MTWEQGFSLASLPVAPLWLLMVVAPTWSWTRRIVGSPWSFAPLAVVYAALVAPRLDAVWPAVTRPDLAGIAALLGTPAGATIAWVHFLVFDAFTARWIYLDSRERRVHPLAMVPVLLLTLLMGPAGFLLYLLVRLGWRVRRDAPSPG